jgi:hypothetical protein
MRPIPFVVATMTLVALSIAIAAGPLGYSRWL